MPLIGLKTKLDEVGLGALSASHSHWQNVVALLVKHAALIIVVPSWRSSVTWEVNYLLSNDMLNKTLFIMPRAQENNSNDFEAEWNKTVNSIAINCQLILPKYDKSGALISTGYYGYRSIPLGFVYGQFYAVGFKSISRAKLIRQVNQLLGTGENSKRPPHISSLPRFRSILARCYYRPGFGVVFCCMIILSSIF